MVTMQALRSWRNDSEEGAVRRNDRIVVSERRARQLEAKRPQLARRIKTTGPSHTKPVGPDTVKVLPRVQPTRTLVQGRPPFATLPTKPVSYRHKGGGWYALFDAEGEEVATVQGKDAAEEAVSG